MKSAKHVQIQQMKGERVNFRRKMYLLPFTTSIAVLKKINLISIFLYTMHIYLIHLNKIDVNSESD